MTLSDERSEGRHEEDQGFAVGRADAVHHTDVVGEGLHGLVDAGDLQHAGGLGEGPALDGETLRLLYLGV